MYCLYDNEFKLIPKFNSHAGGKGLHFALGTQYTIFNDSG